MAMNSETKQADNASIAPLAKRFLWASTASGVNRFILGLIILCVLLFSVEFFWHRHVKVSWESLFGFHAIAGFVSFTVIVVSARLLRLIIRRDEQFYSPDSVDGEDYPDVGTQKTPHERRITDSLSSLWNDMMGRSPS